MLSSFFQLLSFLIYFCPSFLLFHHILLLFIPVLAFHSFLSSVLPSSFLLCNLLSYFSYPIHCHSVLPPFLPFVSYSLLLCASPFFTKYLFLFSSLVSQLFLCSPFFLHFFHLTPSSFLSLLHFFLSNFCSCYPPSIFAPFTPYLCLFSFSVVNIFPFFPCVIFSFFASSFIFFLLS